MRTQNDHIVHVELRACTYLDYICKCVVEGEKPTPEQLQQLADNFYERIDGGDYKEDPHCWDEVWSVAKLWDEPNRNPTYRARLIDGE